MDINALLLTLGLPGFFSSRAFTPAFVTALILRYGDQLPYLKEIAFLQATGAEPTWFTSNWTILALGVLAVLELLATKSPEAEEMLGTVHQYAKTGMTFVTATGILSSSDISYVRELFEVSQAGLGTNLWAAFLAGLTFLASSLRNGVFALLSEADPDDDLGLRQLLSWFEDTWGAIGLFFIFLYPFVILGLVAVFLASLYGLRRYAAYREERSKVPCPACEGKMYQSALACPSCGESNPTPKAVGLLGQTKADRAAPPARVHALRLASKRRCPRCATRLPERTPRQACPACGTVPFEDAGFRSEYAAMVGGRLPRVLGICFLFGLVPVLGMIPGIMYYRIALLAPYRGYLSAGSAFLLRWLLRLLFIFLITAQAVPALLAITAPPAALVGILIGGLTIPLMALLSYAVYRLAFAAKVGDGTVAA